MIYIAYGSNLNKRQMSKRCPNATPLGKMYLPDYKLVFRGVADIEESKGDYVPVGLWSVTDYCIKALDRYEGVPRLYSRVYLEDIGFTYMMNSRDYYSSPMLPYLESIEEGYNDFGFGDTDLEKLVDLSQQNCSGFGDDSDMTIGTGHYWYLK